MFLLSRASWRNVSSFFQIELTSILSQNNDCYREASRVGIAPAGNPRLFTAHCHLIPKISHNYGNQPGSSETRKTLPQPADR
jgi:hypothetical protein